VTNGDGAPLTTITYDAWGEVLNNSTSAQSDRYLYSAREWEDVMGLWYHRARMRGTGTWYSEDPLGFSRETNYYRYVHNNSKYSADPSGLADMAVDVNIVSDQQAIQKKTIKYTYATDKLFSEANLTKLKEAFGIAYRGVVRGMDDLRRLKGLTKLPWDQTSSLYASVSGKPLSLDAFKDALVSWFKLDPCNYKKDLDTIYDVYSKVYKKIDAGDLVFEYSKVVDDLGGDAASYSSNSAITALATDRGKRTIAVGVALFKKESKEIALSIVHELTHMTSGTEDYAYYAADQGNADTFSPIWKLDGKVIDMTKFKLMNNADTYAVLLKVLGYYT
jgi:RHS repeat-associated protein